MSLGLSKVWETATGGLTGALVPFFGLLRLAVCDLDRVPQQTQHIRVVSDGTVRVIARVRQLISRQNGESAA
jgi:hypothetical protein